MYVCKSLSSVAKCRLLIIGIVFCLALSICCDGHVEGRRPKHVVVVVVVVLYTSGGLSLNKEYFLILSVMVKQCMVICNAVRLPVRKIFENSVP
jgi:hypothetical protein